MFLFQGTISSIYLKKLSIFSRKCLRKIPRQEFLPRMLSSTHFSKTKTFLMLKRTNLSPFMQVTAAKIATALSATLHFSHPQIPKESLIRAWKRTAVLISRWARKTWWLERLKLSPVQTTTKLVGLITNTRRPKSQKWANSLPIRTADLNTIHYSICRLIFDDLLVSSISSRKVFVDIIFLYLLWISNRIPDLNFIFLVALIGIGFQFCVCY